MLTDTGGGTPTGGIPPARFGGGRWTGAEPGAWWGALCGLNPECAKPISFAFILFSSFFKNISSFFDSSSFVLLADLLLRRAPTCMGGLATGGGLPPASSKRERLTNGRLPSLAVNGAAFESLLALLDKSISNSDGTEDGGTLALSCLSIVASAARADFVDASVALLPSSASWAEFCLILPAEFA